MANKLTPKCDKKAILLRLDWLMEHGNTLKGSCKKIEKEHGQKWSTTKQQYVRAQAANSDNGDQIQKNHGLCKLSNHQENILLSIVVTFSIMNMGLKAFQIMEFVNLLWGVAISYNWIKRFKTKWKSELSKKKTKLLADKRTNKILSDDVLDFIAQVEVVKEVHPMTAKNSFNYDETRGYV